MKKIISAFLLLFSMFLFSSKVEAKVIVEKQGTYKIAEDEIIEDDLFIGAENVEILGTVDGDVYVGTNTFLFSGEITGDLFVGAGTVNIAGIVGDDLRIGSGNVNIIGAQIGDGVSVGAGSLNIDADTTIGGSLLSGAGTINSKASVAKNMMVAGGNIAINGPIGGELRVGGERISLGSDAKIEGDMTYVIGQGELQMEEGATVSGVIAKKESAVSDFDKDEFRGGARRVWGVIRGGLQFVSFVGALVVGLVALIFLKKPANVLAKNLEKRPFESFGVGLLVFILAGPLFMLLMMTGVGISLAFVLLPLYLLGLYLAKLVTSYVLGRMATDNLGKKKASVYATFTLGLILYYLLRVLPVVGMFTRIMAFFAGLGAIHMSLWAWLKKQKNFK